MKPTQKDLLNPLSPFYIAPQAPQKAAKRSRFARIPKMKQKVWQCAKCPCGYRYKGDPHVAKGESTCHGLRKDTHPECREVDA